MSLYINGKKIPERRDDNIPDTYGSGNDFKQSFDGTDLVFVGGTGQSIVFKEGASTAWTLNKTASAYVSDATSETVLTITMATLTGDGIKLIVDSDTVTNASNILSVYGGVASDKSWFSVIENTDDIEACQLRINSGFNANNATYPDWTVGTGQNGCYSQGSDNLRFAVNGSGHSMMATTGYQSLSGGGFYMLLSGSSAAAALYTINGDLDTGNFTPGADQWAVTAGGVEAQRWTEDTNKLETWIKGKQRVKTTNIPSGTATYTILETDFWIECTRTATGVLTVTLPKLATVLAGSRFFIKDSGYNAGTNNITVARPADDVTATNTIDNVDGSYTINGDGDLFGFQANSALDDWELI